MKSLSKITVAVAVVAGLAVTAQAKVTSKRSAVKGLRVAAVSKSAVQTETAKVSEVAAAPAKKWSTTFLADSYGNVAGLNKQTADIEIDTMVSANYKVNDTTSAKLAVEFATNPGLNTSGQAGTAFMDPSLRVSKSGLLKNDAGVDVSGQARLYLPVGDLSRESGQLAQIRLYGTASKDIAKSLNLSYTINPRFFIQQHETYSYDVSFPAAQVPEGTAAAKFRLLNSVALKYSLNDKIAFEQTVGIYQKWRYNGAARRDQLDAGTSVYITPVSWIELQAGIRQMDDGGSDTRRSMNVYDSTNTEYFLTTVISM